MTHHITICTTYTTNGTATVDLSPKTWDDVKEWFIKWDTLHVLFKGEREWTEIELDTDTADGTDWKRPRHTDIYEGEWEFDIELDSKEG